MTQTHTLDTTTLMAMDTYTSRLFNGSLEEIRDYYSNGYSVSEIAEKVNLSEHLVQALIERFVMKWDHYSGLPSPEAYKE